MKRFELILSVVFLAACIWVPDSQAATLHVPAGYPAIQDAIDAAVDGDTVLVAPGTYVENIDFTGKAVTVMSTDGPGITVIDGQAQAASVVRFSNGEGPDSVLEGFTLTNGAGIDYSLWGKCGGGVYCDQASPTLVNNIITGNGANYGGGIACLGNSAPTIHYLTFAENVAAKAGEAMCIQSSNPVIKHSILWGTTAGLTNPSITYSCIQGGCPGTGNIDQDPLFLDAAGGDFRLQQHPCQSGIVNPCVDAGDPASPLPEGTTRMDFWPDQGVVDMGCHYRGNFYTVPDDYPTIQAAIDAVPGAGCIHVRAGTYMENIDFKGKIISLVGVDGPAVTVIDGNQTGPVAILDCVPYAWIEGFTLRNGLAMNGGGIFCFLTKLTLWNNVITANSSSGHGGGVYCGEGSLTLEENHIHFNICSLNGGGLYCSGNSPSITNNTVNDNAAGGTGGGIYMFGESLMLQGNTLHSNTAVVNGGGLACFHTVSSTLVDNQFYGNTADASGGGIYIEGASSTFLHNLVHDNDAGGSGGGTYTDGEYLTFQNNALQGNTAAVNGGGLACFHADSSTLEDNQLHGNTATVSGGGIYCEGASPTFLCSTLHDNLAGASGGGLACFRASPHLDSNIIFNNEAGSGGGMGFQQSSPTIVNSMIFGNHAASGGGIASDNLCGPTLTNNTLFGNTASTSGGGMGCGNGIPIVTNCIFWHNVAPAGSQIHGPNAQVTCSCVEGGWPGAGNLDADPLFVDPATHDFHLPLGSPCMDKGDCYAPALPVMDYEGDLRICNYIVDLGADEYNSGGKVLHVPVGYPAIQDAIDAAAGGDTVLVAPGTYVENIDFLGKAVTVKSSNGAEATVIDGNQLGSVVVFGDGEGADSILDGFTITNGRGTHFGPSHAGGYSGGGINCGGSPIITNNIITENSVSGGWNYAFGGGIGCHPGSSPVIMNNIIYDNETYGLPSYGGGIGGSSASPVIMNNIISDNRTNWSGGGIGIIASDNTGSPIIKNNTIANNYATTFPIPMDGGGGGLCIYGCKASVTNNILCGNMARTGPEIFIKTRGSVDIDYSNVAGGLSSVYVKSGSTLNWGEGMIDADPLFADPTRHDYHLTCNSPCINRGANRGAPSEDMDGDIRPFMGTVDMGADEFTGIHSLEADLFSVSEATGGTVKFEISTGPGNGGRTYLVLGSLSGTAPGTPLPGGPENLRLNWDAFTEIVLGSLNTSLFMDFLGTTDGSGHAAARLNVPAVHGHAGVVMYFAYCLCNPFDFVSNPIVVEIVP